MTEANIETTHIRAARPNIASSDILPHTGPMLFIDKVIAVDIKRLVGEFSLTVSKGKAYLDHTNKFNSAWFIEAMAQAAGGLFYFQSGGKGAPPQGYLVGLESFNLTVDQPLTIGQVIRLKAKMTVDFYPFGVYECEAWHKDKQLAAGEFKFVVETESKGKTFNG